MCSHNGNNRLKCSAPTFSWLAPSSLDVDPCQDSVWNCGYTIAWATPVACSFTKLKSDLFAIFLACLAGCSHLSNEYFALCALAFGPLPLQRLTMLRTIACRDLVERCFASCVEVVLRKSQLFLQVSFLWVQSWFESVCFLFDSVLLSAGQSEKSVSILFCFELQESMCVRFCCVSSRLSSIACSLITPCRNYLTSSSVDDSVKPELNFAQFLCGFLRMMSHYCF